VPATKDKRTESYYVLESHYILQGSAAMQPEEQQRIMGYFIEEAKDHLNTIEQGLLSLQATIEDSEKANEVFRAAHSVKGGAAMLGLESIQKTAHRMEDYFKILKEAPVQVDRVLETMFLRISDGLKDLLEQLEGPFGLTQDKAQEIMADVEPVFGQIEAHLETLVGKSAGREDISGAIAPTSSPEAAKSRFKRDGASYLRKMLAAFKRPDDAGSRKAIQDTCTQLHEMGAQFELSAWCDLIETARLAAASSNNDYRALAPVLIKEIKQAQDFVLAGRASEIAVSDAMQALLPEDILEEDVSAEGLEGIDDFDLEGSLEDSLHGLDFASEDDLEDADFGVEDSAQEDAADSSDTEDIGALFEGSEESAEETAESTSALDDDLGDLFGNGALDGELEQEVAGVSDSNDAEPDDIERLSLNLDFDEIPSELSTLDRDEDSQEKADESLDALLATVNVTGPEVGEEELNSLADLFDGDLDELDNTLGGHAFVTEEMQLHPEKIDTSSEDDLQDLLSSDAAEEKADTVNTEEVEDDLFGGTLTDGEFAIADSADFDELDLSKDPWDEDKGTELDSAAEGNASESSLSDAEDDIFGVDLDGVELGDIDLDVQTAELEDLEDLEDLEEIRTEEPLQGTEDELEAMPEEGAEREKQVAVPQFQSAHSVSPKADDIEFPTLTGQKLQDAEEDIDSFFLGKDDDESIEQLSDSPWGEISSASEDSEAIASPDESTLPDPSEPKASEMQEIAQEESLDFDSVEEVSETAVINSEELADNFLEADPSTSFDVDLNVDQAGTELDEWLGNNPEEAQHDAFVAEASTDDLWDELSAPADNNVDLNNTELDLEAELDETELDLEAGLDDTELDDTELNNTELDLEAELLSNQQDNSGIDNFDNVFSTESDLKVASEIEAETRPPDSEAGFLLDTAPVAETAANELTFDNLSFDDDGLDSSLELGADQTDHEITDDDALGFLDFDLDKPEVAQLDISNETTEDKPEPDETLLEELTLENVASTDLTEEATTSVNASQDVSGDELSEEILADFETAFGTGIFGEVASEETLSETSDDSAREETAHEAVEISAANALDISELEIDGLLDEGLEEDLDGFLTEAELAEIDGSLPELEDLDKDDFEDGSQEVAAFAASSIMAATVASQSTEANQNTEQKEEQASHNSKDAFDDVFDDDGGFDDLDALLSEELEASSDTGSDSVGELPTFVGDRETPKNEAPETAADNEDFDDLERLLEDGSAEGTTPPPARRSPQATARRSSLREQTMRVSVSHLDTLSNLVGELVVSRNTLERDQERLRQFLDNLLFQVQQLNDVGQRMRDLYERSLLESSLMSNRRAHNSARAATTQVSEDPTSFFEDHATGETFDALEMDRFTGFHTLSQEMIELIVRVRESSSDIGYTVESSDQVTRQFRQITTQLQEGLNTARMVAFSQAADRLPRAVRDISLKCGKEAHLVVEGQDTLIDKMIVEHLYDPLTHLVNNAITHGIETPKEREAAGKSSEGSITVRAFYQGNQTVIYVADDGGGINTEFVKRKAIEKKLITQSEAEDLSDIETYDLLFHPGFSTRDQADDFAGRGVGMDVVRTSLAEIRGSITIDSEMGKGTSFTIRLPLTLSISKALSCVSNQARIAFPMDGVEDMLDVPRDQIVKNDKEQDCVRWRDTLLTFQPVTDLLKFNRTLGRGRVYGGSQEDDILSIIVLRSANTYTAVQVDQVIGEQEIVIKQLEGPVPKPLGIAGATVLGDGRVMPIADVIELIDIAMGRVRREPSSMLWTQDEAASAEESPIKQDPTVLIVDDSITVRELLSMSFNKVGYRVEQARDGQEAWDKLRSGLPCDLVFCDIEMPRMDGLELLSRMQKDNHLKSIPIAMLTSRGADRHRQMAVDLGASGYFTKPYLEEALLDAAQRMLNGETLAKGRGG